MPFLRFRRRKSNFSATQDWARRCYHCSSGEDARRGLLEMDDAVMMKAITEA
jgi:hypothetical protein